MATPARPSKKIVYTKVIEELVLLILWAQLFTLVFLLNLIYTYQISSICRRDGKRLKDLCLFVGLFFTCVALSGAMCMMRVHGA